MILLLWLLCLITCLGLGVCLTFYFLKYSRAGESWQTLIRGIKEGLKGSGFLFQRRYFVELYVWETTNDEEVCEDCLDRASWPPMDIADWMKEGLPGTQESETECGEACRCKLVPYNPSKVHRHRHHR